MPVYKRNGATTYSYDFRLKGIRHSGNTGETEKRKARETEERVWREAKGRIRPEGQPMTVGEATARYYTEVGENHVNSDTTLVVFAWLDRQLGKATLLSRITDADVARLIAKKRTQDRAPAPATLNRLVVQPLRALLSRAAETWKQEVQPIKWAKHLLKEPEERVRELTPEEEAALFATLRGDYHPIVRFALLTGCRMAECLDLKWRHIDWTNRQMRVTGKGSKTRTVPISNATHTLLSALRTAADAIPAADAQVFTYTSKRADNAPRGQRVPIQREGLKSVFERAVTKAGIEDFSFHDLRHTCATRLLRKSGNLRLVKDLLGHSDMNTTLKYAHVTKDDLRAAMNATEIATAIPVASDKHLKDNEK